MFRLPRIASVLVLAGFLSLGTAPRPAVAQEPAAEGAEGEGSPGRPLDGYFGTAIMAFIALFVVAKSARR